jgi:hypothetical protein
MGSRPWVAVATSVIGVLFSCGNPERDLGSPAKGEAGTAGEAGGGAPNGAFGGQASGAVGGQSNGDGGDSAGSGGSAGETSGQACKVDADCSDHLACNGIETCVEKVCHAGIAPCPNDDPAHCDAVCVEANGAAVCSVQGQDKDKDGHLSSACMKNVGDDCNDADPTVHAGAPEICDGLDNDCDGKVDLADGLSLSGIATPVSAATGQSRYEPVIAWAPDRSVYGIVYEDKLAGSIYFETIDQAGAQKVEPVAIAPNGSLPGESLAWGGTNFGVAWSTSSGGAFDNRYSNGTVGAAPKQPTGAFGPTQVAYSGDGTSATLYHQVAAGGTTTAFLHGPAGFSTTTILGDDTNVSMVGTATGFVVGAVDTGVGRVVLFNSTFTMDLPEGLMGGVPVVAAGSNGFASAIAGTLATDQPRFYSFDAGGGALCSSVKFADKSFIPASMIATSRGYLVVSSGAVRVQEVFTDCTLGALFTVDLGPATNVGIAGSAAGYGVVWQDTASADPKLRLFGPNFCD